METSSLVMEIDFFDLFKYIKTKWKLIIVFILISALLGVGYACHKTATNRPKTDEEIKALTKELTSEEVEEVENAAEIINTYRLMYDKQKDYNSNSIYQNLDPYSIKTVLLTYYVENHFKVTYPVITENNDVSAIVQTYSTLLQQDDIYEKMSNKIGGGIKASFYRELVSVGTNMQGNGVFTVRIYADTDESAREIADFIKSELNEATNGIVEVYGDVDLKLTSEVYKDTIDLEVVAVQQKNIDNLYTITKSILSEESLFYGNQLTYLKALVHEELEKTVSFAKCIVVGAFVGLIVSIVTFCAVYVFSDSIKTKEEFEKRYNIYTLDSDVEIDVAKIKVLLNQSNYSSVAFLVDSKVLDKDKVNSIVCGLEEVCEVIVLNNTVSDADSIKEFSNVDSAIICIQNKESSKEEVTEEIKLCQEYGIAVISGIVL